MQANTLPHELREAAPGLAEGLRAILAGLAALIARAFLRDPRHAGLILPLWRRLTRAATRADRLMARLAAGTPPRPGRPCTRPGTGARSAALPAGRAWLIAALRHEAVVYALRLEHLLARPDIAAIVAHSPQTARLLRPICHILGVTHHALARAPRQPRRRPAPPAPASAPSSAGPGAATQRSGAPRGDGKAGGAAGAPVPPPPPLGETAPCPHVFWPWFPRSPAPAPPPGPALRRLLQSSDK